MATLCRISYLDTSWMTKFNRINVKYCASYLLPSQPQVFTTLVQFINIYFGNAFLMIESCHQLAFLTLKRDLHVGMFSFHKGELQSPPSHPQDIGSISNKLIRHTRVVQFDNFHFGNAFLAMFGSCRQRARLIFIMDLKCRLIRLSHEYWWQGTYWHQTFEVSATVPCLH